MCLYGDKEKKIYYSVEFFNQSEDIINEFISMLKFVEEVLRIPKYNQTN